MTTFSNPKLSDRLRPDVEATPLVIAEIEKLEQQLAAEQAKIDDLRQKLTIARELLEDCSGWLRGDKSAEGELRRRVLTFLKPAEES